MFGLLHPFLIYIVYVNIMPMLLFIYIMDENHLIIHNVNIL